MAVKTKYASQTDIPEALRPLYKPVGSEWVLDTEGDEAPPAPPVDKGRVEQFRQRNIELQKQLAEATAALEAAKEAYGGTDPEAVKTILAKVNDQNEQELIRAGRLDELVARRTQSMQGNYQKQLEAAAKKAAEAEKAAQTTRDRFASTYLAEQTRKAIEAKKLRIVPSALDDILRRGRETFKLADDLQTFEPASQDYGPDGKPPTIDTWIDALTQQAPHFFEGGGGGGTTPNKIGGGGGVRVLKRSEIPDDKYAEVLASGAKVVMG
jgi:hypothetical protein